ncbi:MAG TPA: hypothetical protein VI248_18560 [Kineosporiaceae bacterium]
MTTTATMTQPSTTADDAIAQVLAALSGGAPPGTRGGAYDGSGITAGILTGVRDGLMLNPKLQLTAPKAPVMLQVQDPQQLAQKDFWNSVFSVTQDVLPIVVQALSKDYAPPKSAADIRVPAERRSDKDWLNFVGSLLQTTVPQVINLVQGKDYNPGSLTPPQVPPGKDKDWVNDAVQVGIQALPFVLSLF